MEQNLPDRMKTEVYSRITKLLGYSELHAESVKYFEYLEENGIDKTIYWDGTSYGYLRDLAYAEDGNPEAIVRCALAEGDFKQAKEFVDQIPEDAEPIDEVLPNYPLAIELGERLLRDKSITLTPEEIRDCFYGVDEHWRVEGEELVCQQDEAYVSQILLPFGIEDYTITGEIHWERRPNTIWVLTNTQAKRDTLEISYWSENQVFNISRARRTRYRESTGGDTISFRCDISGDGDTIMPTNQERYEFDTLDKCPSGFGFRMRTMYTPGTMRLKNIRVTMN